MLIFLAAESNWIYVRIFASPVRKPSEYLRGRGMTSSIKVTDLFSNLCLKRDGGA